MVHETTEYRRKFRWNSSQKRYQIWEENRKFREARRLREFHHEPLPWEESDQSCSSSTTEDAEHLPPSKLKQKHLDLIRITEAAKQQNEQKAGSIESVPPSPNIHSPFPEKETCDVGIQTPNWELLEDEKLPLQDRKLKELDLHEVSRRLKEEIAHSHGTLSLIEQIIEKGKQNYSARPILREEKMSVPTSKKFSSTAYGRSLSPDKKQRLPQSKSQFNLHARQSKVTDALNRSNLDTKVIKNVLHPSATKLLKKSYNDVPFTKQVHPKIVRRPYKREGHRVINDLWKYGEDSASKWLSDYDNKCRYGVRSAPLQHMRH